MIARLFGVTADYLLDDAIEEPPKVFSRDWSRVLEIIERLGIIESFERLTLKDMDPKLREAIPEAQKGIRAIDHKLTPEQQERVREARAKDEAAEKAARGDAGGTVFDVDETAPEAPSNGIEPKHKPKRRGTSKG